MMLHHPVRYARGVRRGLSLLEVLVALAILVLAIVAIGRLVDIGTDRGNDARAYTRGTRLAQAKMAEVEAGLISLSSETEGQFEGDDAAWQFRVTPEPAGPPNLYNVTVRVTLNMQGRPVEIILTQLLFDPTMMGSAAQAERPAPPDDTGTGTGMTGMGGTTP
jgi:general secretion pathway protein I